MRRVEDVGRVELQSGDVANVRSICGRAALSFALRIGNLVEQLDTSAAVGRTNPTELVTPQGTLLQTAPRSIFTGVPGSKPKLEPQVAQAPRRPGAPLQIRNSAAEWLPQIYALRVCQGSIRRHF